MKESHILLVEDNEGDIILRLEAFQKVKTRYTSVWLETAEMLWIFFIKEVIIKMQRSQN